MVLEAKAARQEGPRIRREKETVAHMIFIYCQGMHPEAEKRHRVPAMGGKRIKNAEQDSSAKRSLLCDDCHALYKYSQKRLTYCRFGEAKTTCANCPVHCYALQEREDIKRVMRYAGARMLLRHPWLAFRHVLDGRPRGG